MAAAHIAAMRNVLGDEPQCRGIFAKDPFDAQRADLPFKSRDRQFELALLKCDRDEFVRKWSAFLIRRECIKERQAVFPAGKADADAVAGAKHREAAHGTAHRVENFLFNTHRITKRRLYVKLRAP